VRFRRTGLRARGAVHERSEIARRRAGQAIDHVVTRNHGKHTSRAQYLDNVVRGSIVHVRGESAEDLFARNVLEGSAYVFEGYTNEGYANDPGWVRVPHHNEIVGGSIAGSKFCFRFHGAHDNHARGVLTQGCKPSSAQP
jgi:hypothetical protein